MMDTDDLHEKIMLFGELEEYFSTAHASPEDEIRRKKLLQKVVQAKQKAVAEFNELEVKQTYA
ncbi:MAG: hypothetical protein WA666_06000 [Nitrospirota bacterium]